MSKLHSYSFFNTLLLMSQMPTISIPASFTTWKELGRWVKRGEKALTILCPITRTVLDEKTGEEHAITSFRARACVFDISQTAGNELPTLCTQFSGGLSDSRLLDILCDIAPVPVIFRPITESGAHGYYSPKDLEIVVDSTMDELMQARCLVHEISHSLLQCKGGTEEHADRRTAEVQAESISFTVCTFLDLDVSDYSFSYIAGWSKNKELSELKESMETIRKTADYIISEIEKRMSDTAITMA